MESCIDLNCEPDLLSFQGDDSNAIMLPSKKKNKKKGMSQVPRKLKGEKKPELSKSQKRKLKKLEEEKVNELRLSKSIETLEKYKIREDAYSLMWSSSNLGQVETGREKRRREMHFSKVGLELPHSDRPFKRRTGESNVCEIEPNPQVQSQAGFNGSDPLPPFIEEKEVPHIASVSLKCSEELVCDNGTGSFNRIDGAMSVNEVSNESNDKYMIGLPQNSLPTSSSNGQKIAKPEDKVDGSPKVNISSMSKLDHCHQPRVLTTPTIVHVSRPKELEDKRRDLPIVMMEQEIMEAINENLSVIICGETGCGKTTQVPQFLFEAGFASNQCTKSGIIGVTQPRRVAVLATAKRVAYELGLRFGKEVGFQVRHDKRIGDNCSIKFMTDGILLRELQTDFLLKRYSVLILDEAHERSLNTDILIGMLSRIIQERQRIHEEQKKYEVLSGKTISPEKKVTPLRLVLMSATLRVEDFVSGKKIFRDPPPVIEVPTRQYPVTIHFSKRTEIVDYVGQAYKKVLSIHKRLPSGGILVFVTGQREVEYLCRLLRKASREMVNKSSKGNNEVPSVSEGKSVEESDTKEINEAFDIQGNSNDQQTDRFSSYDGDDGDLSENESDLSYDSEEDSDLEVFGDDGDLLNQKTVEPEGNLADVLGDDGNLDALKNAFETLAGKNALKPVDAEGEQVVAVSESGSKQPNHVSAEKKGEQNGLFAGAMSVFPLYAMLPASAQLRVFEGVREGERLVVVATNVAETSLTIPGIKYVVDTGREKVKNYNSSSGMETYEVQWISKASAAQRAGRAGRTGPGHCYRLYSSAVFNNIFPDFSCAEISKIPVDGVVLLMKSMGIDKVANFPFPTPPDMAALIEAERCLKILEAINSAGRLTPLGIAMARYPMSPRHSRMLLTVIQIMKNKKGYKRPNLVLGYTVAAAAALSLSNPFIIQFEGTHADTNGSKQEDDKSVLEDTEIALEKEEKSRKKKRKESARVFHSKFSNPTSDALTIAYVLQCFEQSESQVEFCNNYSLHLKTMEEMSKLRKQLLNLVFNQSSRDIQLEFLWAHGTMEDVECAWRVSSDKHPLALNEEELLGQAICAGWADRVAKRVKGHSGLSDGERKVNSVRYQACMVSETVFLHRWSSVSKFAPEFLVYSELLHTRRPYINGATTVKHDWLVKYAGSLCTFSAPLADPKPYYEPQTDKIFCWVTPTFGPHLWQLPLHSLTIKDDMQRVAVFASSLLSGHILPCLRSVRNFLAASPASILRPEASGHKRVGNLLSKLKTRLRTVDSCAMLREVWDENPREFYSEILDWFQEGFRDRFDDIWAEMHREVLVDPKLRFPKKVKRDKS